MSHSADRTMNHGTSQPPGDAVNRGDLPDTSMERPLEGRRIAFLESRRASELAQLIERAGGIPYRAPALREVPLEDDTPIQRWVERLIADDFQIVIFLTGVGCRLILECAQVHGRLAAAVAALGRTRVVARGPKPSSVLKQHGVPIAFVPPEPNTSEELLEELARWDIAGQTVGVQLYGGETPYLRRLRRGLSELGAQLIEVAPYRWEGPIDDQPLRDLIGACLNQEVDALAVLSSSQIHHLFEVAGEDGQEEALRQALNQAGILVAAVGPVTARAIEERGVRVALQPAHPKMGHLVKAIGAALSRRGSR